MPLPPSARHLPAAQAALRIAAGLAYFSHGAGKLFGWFGSGDPVELMSRFGAAGLIEVVAGACLVLGLATRPMAFVASGEMAVAYFWIHMAGDGSQLWWWVNRGELPFLYAFIWLFFAAAGPGPLSVDGALASRRNAGG
jgi:putative oxidoreductase